MKRYFAKRDRSRALVLIAVMWVIILLSIIVAVIARTSRLDTRISLASAERFRCKWTCRAGIETAIAVLNDDESDCDSFEDLWYDNPEDFNNIQMDMCRFDVEVIDEAGKLNVNTASRKQLMQLPEMTEEVAASIIDWRDNDSNVGAGGAEAGYYMNLPNGYRIRNGNFKTFRELLLVKGIVPEMLYGSEENVGWVDFLTCYSYQVNRTADDGERVNINDADESKLTSDLNIRQSYAKWIVDNRPKDGYKKIAELITDNSPDKADNATENSDQAATLDVQTVLDIADDITVSGDRVLIGKVNINTASETVLCALLEGDEQIAVSIMAYRESQPSGFTAIGDLTNIKSVTKKIAKKIVDNVTTRSGIFSVKSLARAETTNVVYKIEAVVSRDATPAEILYWHWGRAN